MGNLATFSSYSLVFIKLDYFTELAQQLSSFAILGFDIIHLNINKLPYDCFFWPGGLPFYFPNLVCLNHTHFILKFYTSTDVLIWQHRIKESDLQLSL
jgi:hypothetical protein